MTSKGLLDVSSPQSSENRYIVTLHMKGLSATLKVADILSNPGGRYVTLDDFAFILNPAT